MMPANRIQRLGKCNEVARDEPCPLMDQLVERLLPVCSRFSPVDGAGIVGDYFTVKCDVFRCSPSSTAADMPGNASDTARTARPRQSVRRKSRCTKRRAGP